MSDISIIELFFYGFLELFSLSMLIISVIKEIPDTKARAIIRAIYLIPGMIAAAFLGGTGQNITLNTVLTNSTTFNATNATVFKEVTNQANFIALQNPVWGYLHLLIMMVLFVFIANQIYNLLTKND